MEIGGAVVTGTQDGKLTRSAATVSIVQIYFSVFVNDDSAISLSRHKSIHYNCRHLKVRKTKKQILPKKKERKKVDLRYCSTCSTLGRLFRSFFGRIEGTINCFRDFLTFSSSRKKKYA